MRRLIALLLGLPLLSGAADINYTNIPFGVGVAETNTVLGETNGGHNVRVFVSDIMALSTNGWPWTNLTVAHASAVTNGYPWTNVPVAAASTVPITGVTTPGEILTNGNDFAATFSNKVTVVGGILATGTQFIALSNGTARVLMTNGNIYASAGIALGGADQTSTTYGVNILKDSTAGFRSLSTYAPDGTTLSGAGLICGSTGSPTAADQRLGFMVFSGATSQNCAAINANSAESWAGAGKGSYFSFQVTPIGAAARVEKMRLTDAGSLTVANTLTATNGVVQQMLYTNGYTVCTTNKQFYMVNSSTNPIFVLPNAANVPGVIFRFSTTNYGAQFIITNATGTQTIANGSYLSYTNTDNGIKVTSFISDGAHWWLASKGKVTLPNASWSCSTNTTFANVTNTITLDTQENNNGQGIYLDNSGWFTSGVGSRIWVTNAGQYMITFSAVWSKVGGGASNGDIWLRQNGTDVPRTMTLQTIQNATSTNVMTVNFIMPVTSTTYFDLQGASPDGTAQLQAMPAITSPFNRPACPSIIVTVNKVSD